MFSLQDYDLLIVSDLHLSEGRNPETKKVSLNEDFFFDEEFARFLKYYMSNLQRKWHLIINGDFMDFLQVVSPISPQYDRDFLEYLGVNTIADALAQLSYDVDRPEYGLGSGEKETVYKLFKIMCGHQLFFEALAEFVAAGNIVSIGRGNHDVEFIYPGVREQFLAQMQRVYKAKLKQDNPQSDTNHEQERFAQLCRSGAIRFIDWFYYEPNLIWIEHGNQYDSINSFKYWLAPFLPNDSRVELPWGSFFVRYLFNQVELEAPFADNIKPQSRFIHWFLTRKTGLALRFLYGDGKYMLKKLGHAWRNVSQNSNDEHARQHTERLKALATPTGPSVEQLLHLDQPGFRCVSVLEKPEGGWRLVRLATIVWPLSLLFLSLVLLSGFLGAFWIAIGVLLPIIPEHVAQPFEFFLQYLTANAIGAKLVYFVRWPSLFIFAILGGSYLINRLRRPSVEGFSTLANRAAEIGRLMNVPCVTMGHTHEVDLQVFENGTEYFNTGTWTKVFGEDEDRLLREESELVFLQITRQPDTSAKLLKWENGANEPRLVMLFEKPRKSIAILSSLKKLQNSRG